MNYQTFFLASDFQLMAEVENLHARPEYPEQIQLDLPSGGPGTFDERRRRIGTVLYDPRIRRYRMWYVASGAYNGTLADGNHIGYAESDDGFHWEKPEVGLYEYHGSRRNNIVFGLPDRMDSASVLLDSDGKFKMAVMNAQVLKSRLQADSSTHVRLPEPAFMGIAESIDGVQWHFDSDATPAIQEKFEIGRLLKEGDCYIMNGQQSYPYINHPNGNRCVVFYRSTDLKHWEKISQYYSFDNGKYDQTHCGIAPCLKIGATHVGLAGRFYEAPELPEQSFEADLVYSHDGCEWVPPFPASTWLRRGVPGAWNGGGVCQGQGYAEDGDTMYFYFSGSNCGNDLSSSYTPAAARFKTNRFAFAGIAVYWDIGYTGIRHGMLRTPVAARGPIGRIVLNCTNFTGPGCLRVSLTDESGNTIPHFSTGDSLPITQDGIAVPVLWNHSFSLPEHFSIRVDFQGKGLCPELPKLYTIATI